MSDNSNCNWCSGNSITLKEVVCGEVLLSIDVENTLTIEGVTPTGWEFADYDVELEINYCPNCGRKL
ncbi:MAG: hypothetical protein RSC24_06185 [Clostridium sp.]